MTHRSPIPAPFTDAELVAQTLAGSREAFAEIIARYQTLICSLNYSATGSISQSEDLSQETFLIAWQQLSELREPSRLRPWLCGIARHLHLRAHREHRREPVFVAEPLDAAQSVTTTGASVPEQAITREEEAILWRSLERLPDTYREPLVLFYRQHESIERVATLLDITEETARQRLSRGRKLLQDEVAVFVEGALRQSAPDTAFSASVMAMLPLQGYLAPGATKTAGLTAWISLSVAGLFASLLGSLGLIRLAATPRVRRFTVRLLAAMWLDCIALWIALPVTESLCMRTEWTDATFARIQLGCYFLWAAIMAVLVIVMFRRFLAFHREITPLGIPPRVVPASRSVGVIAALMTVGSFAWLVQLTWLAHDFPALVCTLAAVGLVVSWIFTAPAMLRRLGRDVAAYAWVPAAFIATTILVLVNLRLDFWLAALRGTSLEEAHRFLPMNLVHLATALLLVVIASAAWLTRPRRSVAAVLCPDQPRHLP